MAKYLLTVDYDGGAVETPMTEWAAEDVKAHMDYYRALIKDTLRAARLGATRDASGGGRPAPEAPTD